MDQKTVKSQALGGSTVRSQSASELTVHHQAIPPVPTIPAEPVTRQHVPPAPHHPPHQPSSPVSGPGAKHQGRNWLLASLLALFVLLVFIGVLAVIGVVAVFNSGILPGVTVAGVDLGGLSQQEAAARLQTEWTAITLRDGDRTWNLTQDALGVHIDAGATAERAYRQGRGEGDFLGVLLGETEVMPVVSVDANMLTASLETLAGRIEIEPVNAGVELVDGQVRATPPHNGRALDVAGTVAQLQRDGAQALASGAIDLVMFNVQPAITDATLMVEAASALLNRPLVVSVYDPVTGDIVDWAAEPEVWARWLTAVPDQDSAYGLAMSVEDAAVRQFLESQSTVFDETRYIDLDEAVASVQDAVASNRTTAVARVYHHDRQHVVQPGDSIVSVAWDYGVPYPWIQQANPGVGSLTVGATITIPSPDNFLPYPVVPEKRIVVSISEQRTRVYENGQLIWDWPASTGIYDSPTWPGVYQIISHEPNAYAANWNLWMPNFMGVYQPIPGSEFTNGFHGYPTRGGGQILWQNNLGSRVTYGCIMLSDTNVQQLYNWAEEGVVVEIRP